MALEWEGRLLEEVFWLVGELVELFLEVEVGEEWLLFVLLEAELVFELLWWLL